MATPTPEPIADGLQHGLQNVADYTYSEEPQQPGAAYPPHYGSPAPSGLSPSPFYGGDSSSAYPEPPQMVSGYPSPGFSPGPYPLLAFDSRPDMSAGMGPVTSNHSSRYFWPLSNRTASTADSSYSCQSSNAYASTPGTTPSSTPQITTRTTRSGHPIGGVDPLRPRPAGVQKATASSPGGGSSSRTNGGSASRPSSSSATAARNSSRTAQRKRRNPNAKPSVEQPLSTLLAHLNDTVADVDIAAYVHRSIETRQREVEEDKHKKIKRPMNAFMLYRKAFQNRIKSWQTNDNHQGVSKVAGDGWPLESDETHEQFKEWARVERDMHAAAFPDYKFAPTKTRKNGGRGAGSGGGGQGGAGAGGGGGKNGPGAAFSDGDDTDLEDNWSGLAAGVKRPYSHMGMLGGDDPNDPDWRPSGGGRVYSGAPAYHHPVPRQLSHSPYSTPPPQLPPAGGPQQHLNMSHYQYSNPNKPLPRPYPLPDQQGFYRQQRVDVSQHAVPPGYAPEHNIQFQNVYFEDQILPPHQQPPQHPQYHHPHLHPHHRHQQPPPLPPPRHGLLESYSPVYEADDLLAASSAHSTPPTMHHHHHMGGMSSMAPPPIPASHHRRHQQLLQHQNYQATLPPEDDQFLGLGMGDGVGGPKGGGGGSGGGDDFRLALADYAPEYEHPYLGEGGGFGLGFDTTGVAGAGMGAGCFDESTFALDPALEMATAALVDPALEGDLLGAGAGIGIEEDDAAVEWSRLELTKDEAVEQILDTQSGVATPAATPAQDAAASASTS